MEIPSQFNLAGETITVTFDPNLINNDDCVGFARYRLNQIFLQPNSAAAPRSKEQIEKTFCHELVHFILNKMGEDKLRSNEKFVDLFAAFLHQAFTTQQFPLTQPPIQLQ